MMAVLYDVEAHTINYHIKKILEDNELEDKDGDFVGSISDDIKDIKKWDNHTPYLYKAYIELLKADGEIIEVVPYRIGFRRIEIKNKVMLLNGERLIIKESAENYLEAILMLKNKNGYVRSIDVAHHLNFTKPSVSVAITW